MGIYDREYYRREGPSFLGSLANRGQVCKWLILINIVFFVLQLATRHEQIHFDLRSGEPFKEISSPFTGALQLDTEAVLHGEVWRLLTYAFLHDTMSLWHIIFNLLFLWWFGSDVEDLYGPREFLAFYLISGVLGGLAFAVAQITQWAPPGVCIGASGAVTAVMVLYALHYPSRLIYVWFFLPVPIWLFVAFQVAQDTLIFASQLPTGTAVTVHLGGAAFAFVYYKMHWRLLNLWPGLLAWHRQRSRPRLRVYRAEERRQPVSVAAGSDTDEQLEAKLDSVLEKVARSGQSSLNESERQILLRASEIYKKRRT